VKEVLSKIVEREDGKLDVYYKGELISTQNTELKASEKLFKYIKGQQR